MTSFKTISLIIPVYNEEAALPYLFKKLAELSQSIPEIAEFIFVDDGSKDRSYAILQEERKHNPKIRILKFSRNFGQQLACLAGLKASTTDATVMIDADLQDPPEVIVEMIKKWQDGSAVVYGVRKSREGESWFKKISARLFYRMLARMTDVSIPLDTGDFRLMDKKVVRMLSDITEHKPFIRGLVSWCGFKQTPLLYDRKARVAGQTKYSLRKLCNLAFDAIIDFSSIPFYWISLMGLLILFFAFVGGGTAVILFGMGKTVPTAAWFAVALAFFSAIHFFVLGFLGEYLARIFREVLQRPAFVVESDSKKDQ